VTRDELQQQKTDLQRKLDARKNTPGYAANVEALKAKIAELDAELAQLDG